MRINLQFPTGNTFSCQIPIRITDINYGGHLANDRYLALAHEARIAWLAHHHYTEMNIEGLGLIMADSAIQYLAEAFYGDTLTIQISASDPSRSSFQLYYKLSTIRHQQPIDIAIIKTGMVFFNYQTRKTSSIPPPFLQRIFTD
mgnify:CR=1 FL=1